MRNYKVSVAMAAYNGEKYIEQQIDSILSQLGENDELIISVNEGTDRTWDIVTGYAERDNRVKHYICEKRGVIKNFENAISLCTGDIVFLSDQDDIWAPGKVDTVCEYFEKDPKISGIVHGHINIDAKGERIAEQPKKRESYRIRTFNIFWVNPVQGSCLAFRREIADKFLPMPDYIPMHDRYIGCSLCKRGKLLYIPDEFLLYRWHEDAVNPRHHNPIPVMIKERWNLLRSLRHV
ncbi:MAG: glycosyltransferase [Lachnospiraceae bacterium]|nr:glycosyltransferase [Lachnospiraceae bacterium]